MEIQVTTQEEPKAKTVPGKGEYVALIKIKDKRPFYTLLKIIRGKKIFLTGQHLNGELAHDLRIGHAIYFRNEKGYIKRITKKVRRIFKQGSIHIIETRTARYELA